MHIGSNFINVDWVLNGKLAQAQNGYFLSQSRTCLGQIKNKCVSGNRSENFR